RHNHDRGVRRRGARRRGRLTAAGTHQDRRRGRGQRASASTATAEGTAAFVFAMVTLALRADDEQGDDLRMGNDGRAARSKLRKMDPKRKDQQSGAVLEVARATTSASGSSCTSPRDEP